ncbi:MAG: hypothetical protein RLZZ565_1398 [Planctomycetota bacterium]
MRLSILAPLALCMAASAEAPPTVHSVCDLSHEFTFYLDGRFHRQYLAEDGRDAPNWGTLSKLDLSNANLLVLVGGDPRLPYSAESIEHVARFVEHDGGTLLLMFDGADPMPPGEAVAARFGARPTAVRAKPPLRGTDALPGGAESPIEFRRGTVLELADLDAPDAHDDSRWTTLVVDAEARPVLAARRAGRGHVVVGSRGLFGQKPDASDPINASWVTPLLVSRAAEKVIDPSRPHRSTSAEQSREVGPLTLEFHEGTEKFADSIHEVYVEVRPHLVAITGVEPAPGMITSMLILPTGGGGFSSGRRIAIGAWWGDYPTRRYPMVELIAHEAGHSWVLPHAEPLWNEPIATWLGIEVGRRLGMPEAQQTIDRQIAAARRRDPGLDLIDPLAADAPRDVVWGKSYFVFEELERLHGPGAMSKYFQAKRRLVPADRPSYSMDDAVAVWSAAVGEDLFPWFRSLAFDVDRSRTDLATP